MAEVIIELDLKRRSGVLAGAVAALRKLSLDFKSQQLIDHEGQPRLILTTEGELDDLAQVLAAYEEARGVSGLADVLVDGQSLMHLPPEPEPEPDNTAADPSSLAAEPEVEALKQALPPSPPPIESPSEPAAADPEPAEELFDVEAFVQQSMGETRPASSETPQARPERKPDPSTAESSSGMKASMVRRRRRRR